MAAALGGLDALVFTGGIGEHATAIRARICDGSAWLGVTIDPRANAGRAGCISEPESAVGVFVMATDEEGVIAGETRRLCLG